MSTKIAMNPFCSSEPMTAWENNIINCKHNNASKYGITKYEDILG
jgi:hypothetical protein